MTFQKWALCEARVRGLAALRPPELDNGAGLD